MLLKMFLLSQIDVAHLCVKLQEKRVLARNLSKRGKGRQIQMMEDTNTSALILNLFGPLKLTVNGNPATFSSGTIKGLFGFLAMHSGKELDRQWVAATIWPDSATIQSLSNNLRPALTDIRKQLGLYADRLFATHSILKLDL